MSLSLSTLISKQKQLEAFDSKTRPTWCSSCGNYGIFAATKRALVLEGITPDKVVLCYDVGCSGNGSDKNSAYTLHGLHGRVTTLAAGVSMANTSIPVIASAGDGATFSEGINHLAHALRNNYPFVFLAHNNGNYGLTTGQVATTTRQGKSMSAAPDGQLMEPFNTLQFVLGLNPSFVARGFAGDVDHLTDLIRQGLAHSKAGGMAYIEIMQACPTFNKSTPQEWYWDKLMYLNEQNHDHSDIWAARKLVDDMDKISVGLIYKREKLGYIQAQPNRAGIETVLTEEVKAFDCAGLMREFMI
jgi:2-oxoglutarate ferredoxin oxidoreductase subunit beta